MTPEYAKEILLTFFREEEIEIRDYSKVKGFEYMSPLCGISVLAYRYPYSVIIQYLTSDVRFKIEVNDNLYLDNTWKKDETNKDVYDFFLFILNKIHISRSEIALSISQFYNKDLKNGDFIKHKRDKKLENLEI